MSILIIFCCLVLIVTLLNIYFISSMSEEFSFDEIVQADWLNDVSRFTDKHLLTHSEVSNTHFLDLDLELDVDLNLKSDHPSYQQTRERNKNNAKNYRDRKRNHLQTMKKQLERLRQDNAHLKSQKVCRWCSRTYQPNMRTSTTTETIKQQQVHRKCNHHFKDMEIEFQNPKLQNLIRKPKTPKIWIALGILFLVLGLNIHGMKGDSQLISRIELERNSIVKWKEKMNEYDKSDYLQLAMNFKTKNQAVQPEIQEKDLIVLDFRSPVEDLPKQRNDQISISKEFISNIQEEINHSGTSL